jgi:AraC-like DNA-binding protein
MAAREPHVADIANMVGFAEPSALHRAFRKWTGMRPADYRPAGARRRVRTTALDLTHRAESD